METRVIAGTHGSAAEAARALFRYQGGKQKLCRRIVGMFPSGIGRYIEPFLGAASVFFEFRNSGFRGQAFLGDWNLDVVNVHRAIAADPDGFERAYRFHVERARHGRGRRATGGTAERGLTAIRDGAREAVPVCGWTMRTT